MPESIRILLLGDIVGQSGCRAVFLNLKNLKKSTDSDIVIVNGENSFEGRGITPEIADQLFSCGVDVITTGNHIGQQKEIFPYLKNEARILRPANYPTEVPGRGSYLLTFQDISVAVINLQGTRNLDNLYCPFKIGRELVEKLRAKTKIIIIDFHAEVVEEKEALALYLNGKISALVGTHTHVQTADERILSGGTAYISDIGMTGPVESVIGMKKEIAIKKSITMMPLKMEVADSIARIMGVIIDIDTVTGRAKNIQRLNESSNL